MAYDRLTLTLTLVLSLGVAGATADDKVGTVRFPTSCSTAVQPDFERAVAMLHSFWFQASTNAFVAVAQQDPGCAIAHWGVAMNLLGNPFAWPPSPKALADGWAAVERAKAAGARMPRERDYVAAIEAFYKDAATVDHRAGAPRASHAVPHLHAARVLARVHRREPGLRERREQPLRPAPRARLSDLRVPADGARRRGQARRGPGRRAPEAHRGALRDELRPGGDPVPLRPRARPLGGRRAARALRQGIPVGPLPSVRSPARLRARARRRARRRRGGGQARRGPARCAA